MPPRRLIGRRFDWDMRSIQQRTASATTSDEHKVPLTWVAGGRRRMRGSSSPSVRSRGVGCPAGGRSGHRNGDRRGAKKRSARAAAENPSDRAMGLLGAFRPCSLCRCQFVVGKVLIGLGIPCRFTVGTAVSGWRDVCRLHLQPRPKAGIDPKRNCHSCFIAGDHTGHDSARRRRHIVLTPV